MPPKNAPPRPKIEGKASKDASKSSTPPASSKAKTTPRENPAKPKAAAQEKPKAKAAVSPRGDLQQQLAAAEARASEAEVRAAEAEARVKVAEEATIAASALEAAAHESHRGEGGKQAAAMGAALARAEAAEKAAAEAEERAANLAKLCEEQKATLAEAEKAAAAVQRSLEEQIAALKQQLSVSGQGESAGPSAEPASGATATDAVADVQAVAGSPFKVLIDLGEDASGDGLQVHVQLDGQLGGLSTSSSDDIAR